MSVYILARCGCHSLKPSSFIIRTRYFFERSSLNHPTSILVRKLNTCETPPSPAKAKVGESSAASKACAKIFETEIYNGPLSQQIRSVKMFSLLTSLSGLIAQPFIMARAVELGTSPPLVVFICSFVGFFTFITPLLLHFITKKYVTSVSYNSQDDSYIATTYTLFLRKNQLHLKPGEGSLPNMPSMFTSISVRGVPLFVDARYFSDVHHYKRIMGFDRPIDFKLKTDNKDDKKN